jgi:hypothetical protein
VKRILTPLCIALTLTGCRGATGASTVPVLPQSAESVTPHAVAAKGAASLRVTPSKVVAAETTAILGANMATWYDITKPGLAATFKETGMKSLRFPGGSESDNYHWKTQSLGPGACSGGYAYPPSTLDALESDIVKPSKMDVAITVNYGSNAACNAGGDPAEAAAWVAYANNTKHYNITWWTVGNEEFGSWETDLHSQPHNGAQYASEVATTFYPQMKAASSTPIKVGVDVEPGYYGGWDQSVLSQAKYDFVELHYYPQGNTVSDSFIIDKGAPGLTQTIDALKKEMQAAGHPNTPIYVGEIGSTYASALRGASDRRDGGRRRRAGDVVDRLRRLQLLHGRRRLRFVAVRLARFRRLHDVLGRYAAGKLFEDERSDRDHLADRSRVSGRVALSSRRRTHRRNLAKRLAERAGVRRNLQRRHRLDAV